jgi:hypothetical protein
MQLGHFATISQGLQLKTLYHCKNKTLIHVTRGFKVIISPEMDNALGLKPSGAIVHFAIFSVILNQEIRLFPFPNDVRQILRFPMHIGLITKAFLN